MILDVDKEALTVLVDPFAYKLLTNLIIFKFFLKKVRNHLKNPILEQIFIRIICNITFKKYSTRIIFVLEELIG
jgi:hypothetical protein